MRGEIGGAVPRGLSIRMFAFNCFSGAEIICLHRDVVELGGHVVLALDRLSTVTIPFFSPVEPSTNYYVMLLPCIRLVDS